MKSPLKWVGSKSRIIDRLKDHFPAGTRLVEPFVGSGSVMLNTDYRRYLLGDINKDVINFHMHCRDNTAELLDDAMLLFDVCNTEKEYYRLRELFNDTKDLESTERSALFLYLNRHCFNALCRYNKAGNFNVPYGKYEKPYLPTDEIVSFAEKAGDAVFVEQTWIDTLQQVRHGDVVYVDPPYIPVSATSSFTNYAKEGFGLPEQKELAETLLALGEYGIPIIASNSIAPLALELYKDFKITTINAPRSVGGASVAKEIIAKLNC